ncbi:MAG: PDDEXK nuclease domain-containing protein [Bacteroidota bacterium]
MQKLRSDTSAWQYLLQIVAYIEEDKPQKAIRLSAYWSIGSAIEQIRLDHNFDAKMLSAKLVVLRDGLQPKYGNRYRLSNLKKMHRFYQLYPQWLPGFERLSWSHIVLLLKIKDRPECDFLLEQCLRQHWSVPVLKRQIQTQYYQRYFSRTATKASLITTSIQPSYVLEFSGLSPKNTFQERQLEQRLIDQLQFFMLELGQGFSFVERQIRLTVGEGEHYYVDLIFYNYLQRRFVLIDLKTKPLRHQDIGQMDFYQRFFDQHHRLEGDLPTMGLLLCPEIPEGLTQYSLLAEHPYLEAATYGLHFHKNQPNTFQLDEATQRFVDGFTK